MRQKLFTYRYPLLFTLAALPMLLAMVHFGESRAESQGTNPTANATSAHSVHSTMPHALSQAL